jgi:hypothetical protein
MTENVPRERLMTGWGDAPLTMTNPVIGVIEWSSDSGTDPAVFLADSVTAVRAAVAQYLIPLIGDIAYIDAAWIAGHPAPDLADAEVVEAWLDDLRAATTDAWLTIYTGSDSPGSDTYADVRAARGAPATGLPGPGTVRGWDANQRVPGFLSGIPHRFIPKPEGSEGGPAYCIAPCHGHRDEPYHTHDGD